MFLTIICLKVLFLLVLATVSNAGIQCLDNNGSPVDWFYVYKLPRKSSSNILGIRGGVAQMYIDNNNNQQWTMNRKAINETKHSVYYTLQQIYDGKQKNTSFSYIMYNDQAPVPPPRTVSSTHGQPLPRTVSSAHGHTKGDIAFDKLSGFWLIHSVPFFPPPANQSYSYGDNGKPYGQTFLCVSFNSNVFNEIGEQLLHTYPQIYDWFFPLTFSTSHPKIKAVLNGQRTQGTNVASLTSLRGTRFTHFAKSAQSRSDLYGQLVAPNLKTSLYVESWRRNGGALPPPICDVAYKVMNINSMKIMDLAFDSTVDHSKWAVSADEQTWICVGDINREVSQLTRAGGTLCVNNRSVHKAFNSSITGVEGCGSTSKKKRPRPEPDFGRSTNARSVSGRPTNARSVFGRSTNVGSVFGRPTVPTVGRSTRPTNKYTFRSSTRRPYSNKRVKLNDN